MCERYLKKIKRWFQSKPLSYNEQFRKDAYHCMGVLIQIRGLYNQIDELMREKNIIKIRMSLNLANTNGSDYSQLHQRFNYILDELQKRQRQVDALQSDLDDCANHYI